MTPTAVSRAAATSLAVLPTASARTHTHAHHPTLFSSASLNTPVQAFVVLPTQNHTFSHNLIIRTQPLFCLHRPLCARAQTHSHAGPGGLSVLHTDPELSWASRTGPGAPISIHMTSTLHRLESPKTCFEFHITPPKRIHVLQLRRPQILVTWTSAAVPQPVPRSPVTLWEWERAFRVCTVENSLSSLSSFRASGELSPCRINTGGCQELCLLTHQGHVNCSCRGGRILQEDLTCRGERGCKGGGRWWGTHGDPAPPGPSKSPTP